MSDELDPDLLGEPSAQEQAAAYAAALRRQAYTSSLGNLMGNKGFADYGNAVAGQAQAQQQMLERGQERSAALKSLDSYRGRKRTVKLSDGTSALFDPLTGGLEKVADAAPQFKVAGDKSTGVWDPGTQTFKQLVAPPPPKPHGGGKGGPMAGSPLDKALRGLREDIDPYSGKGSGIFGKDAGLVTSAEKVLGLVKNPDTGVTNYNLTAKQIPELVQSVAGMLSSGNAAAQAQLEHLMPHTAGMSLAEKLEYVTGHPEEANAPEFVKQYAETAERERKLALRRIHAIQLGRLPFHQGSYATNPKELKAAARGYLKDLSDQDLDAAFQGTYQAPAASDGAPASGGLTPEQQKRLAELRAKRASGAIK